MKKSVEKPKSFHESPLFSPLERKKFWVLLLSRRTIFFDVLRGGCQASILLDRLAPSPPCVAKTMEFLGIGETSFMVMDTSIQGCPINREAIEKAFLYIIAPLEDGIILSLEKVEPIRDEAAHDCFRLFILA